MEISEPNSSNNIGMSMSTSALPAAAQVEVGPDLEEIQTEVGLILLYRSTQTPLESTKLTNGTGHRIPIFGR